jgi:transcriptional regulator with XRE-family HTH domain
VDAVSAPASARLSLVGSVLRGYREAAGYRLDDAALVLECDRSKISRMETGLRGIRPKELRELLAEYNAPAAAQDTLAALVRPRDASVWGRDFREALPQGYLDFAVAEGAASTVLVYAPLRVPELLWTEDYGRAAVAADPTIAEEAEESAVEAAVVHRAGALFERQPACTVVLGEAALRCEVGGPAVTRAQLARLAELSGPGCPWLTIRVLPFSAGAGSGAGEYSVLHFGGLPEIGLAHIAGPQGGLCLSAAPIIDAYTATFRQITPLALRPDQSAQRLRQAAHR